MYRMHSEFNFVNVHIHLEMRFNLGSYTEKAGGKAGQAGG